MYSSDFNNTGNNSKKMNIKAQLLSFLFALLNFGLLVIMAIIGYAYTSDRESDKANLNKEIIDREKACIRIHVELDKKVNEDAFLAWKEGQDRIMEHIDNSSKREAVYQDIIQKLSFMDIDTVSLDSFFNKDSKIVQIDSN